MKKLLALICLAFVAYAQAQTTTTSSTTTSSPGTRSNTTTTSSTSNTSGTVTDYTPGAAIAIDPGTGQPVHFIIGKTVEIMTPDGKVIKAANVRKMRRSACIWWQTEIAPWWTKSSSTRRSRANTFGAKDTEAIKRVADIGATGPLAESDAATARLLSMPRATTVTSVIA